MRELDRDDAFSATSGLNVMQRAVSVVLGTLYCGYDVGFGPVLLGGTEKNRAGANSSYEALMHL